MLRLIGYIFYTELLLLLRRSQEWLYPLVFFIITIFLFPLIFTPQTEILQKHLAGYIWLVALFASFLAIENVFHAEIEDGYLEQLKLNPTPLTFFIIPKLFAQWLIVELPLIFLTPLLAWFFHLSAKTIGILCVSLLLGTPILTLIGSLGVALTLGLRQQGILLGLLILPLISPVLIFSVTMIQQVEAGFSPLGPLAFLAGLTIFAITCLPSVIASALKIS